MKYSNTHLEMRTDKYGTRLIEIQNEEPGVTTVRNSDGTTTHKVLAAVERPSSYRPGDVLYVRETWNRLLGEWIYRADQKPGMKNPGKWHPSIHMSREAARIFLRVTDVRVEQLKNITEKQAKAEGFSNRGTFLKEFFAMYPDSTMETWVWVIGFDRIRSDDDERMV